MSGREDWGVFDQWRWARAELRAERDAAGQVRGDWLDAHGRLVMTALMALQGVLPAVISSLHSGQLGSELRDEVVEYLVDLADQLDKVSVVIDEQRSV